MVLLTAGTNGTRVRQARVTFNARNGAQVLVDRSKVMVGHVLKGRPGHYLKIWPKLGMRVIRINTGPHDRAEFFKRPTAFRVAGFIGSQIARDEERTKQQCAALQVCRLIDDFRLPLSWISARRKLPRRAGVAAIAVASTVDQVASQSHEGPVFPVQIQMHGRDLKPLSNSRLVVVTPAVVVRCRGRPRHRRNPHDDPCENQ
jgi:hypothetical protein